MKDFHVKTSNCPYCGQELDGALDPNNDGRSPEIGDLTICIKCGKVIEIGIGFTLQKIKDKDIPVELTSQIMNMQATIAKIQAQKN